MIFIYLFVFPGIFTMFYIKILFDWLQYKLWSINYGTVKLYNMELEKRKKTLSNQL